MDGEFYTKFGNIVGDVYLKLRERIGTIIHDEDFAPLFAKDGTPGLPPWRLALVTILQFHENLSDRQAAEAVRALIGGMC
jgi:transposase